MKETIDIKEVTVKNFIEKMRPEDLEIRSKLDYGYSYDGKIVILFEIRPVWMDPTEIAHYGFAKIRYYKSREEWNLYWMRASGKWDLYDPFPIATHLEQMLQIIDKDEYGCFFG
jgi:hypothetical protein